MNTPFDYLIIGAGAAGMGAAKALRSLDQDSSVAVLSADTYMISRPMLHLYLSHERDEHTLNFMPKGFLENNNVTWFHDCTISSVDPKKKTVAASDGRCFGYKKLLIASGASYCIPPIPGLREAENVYGFRDLIDAVKIDKAAEGAKKAVIIGAGLVGLDVAYALAPRGISVTVVEMADRPLALQFPKEAAGWYQRLFEKAGVRFALNAKVSGAVLDGKTVTSIETEDGTRYDCDFVVVAAGVRPNCGFLQGSGIAVERGIVVDDYLGTSDENIFAAGDAAGLSGTWEAATKQGVCAAHNMVNGKKTIYAEKETVKNAMNYYGLTGISLGMVEAPNNTYREIVKQDEKDYKRLLIRDNIVYGAILLGNITGMPVWQYAIQNGIDLSRTGKEIWDITLQDLKGL
ncbi:NAD(P)/FAD-dependent oxidoreductase [Candidatus Soleaferrea massiliensis]|uniref:NAD(P)/FAD-dependent oxidoreductase n=1 Tax=Candidatus Soleaferrea massiliensis TaxID=1470354 RepID=UPI00058D11DD|nr:FAD-dependent oxidoreductase [Candidatus Soleaferrea massiliensis]